ncbi:MAG: SHOCT domain-containing protein [Rubrobacter sp.]|nr:SHOCT domain-containing protein [Rubrobacter sp.]MCA3763192.1 SHOCT domain-containing protein [Cutibacterium sp.]
MSDGTKTVLGALGGILLLLVLLAILAGGGLFGGGPMMGPGGMMDDWGWGPGGMMDGGRGFFGILWTLVPLLFWGGLIALIVWAVVRITSGQGSSDDHRARAGSAEEILRERFARGEIDAEEYERSLEVLRGEGSA